MPHICQVIDPSFFRATPDVEVHALNRLEWADAVFSSLENVMDELLLAASLPTLAVFARLTPTGPFISSSRTLVGLAPFDDVFFKGWSSSQVDNRVHGAGVIYLIVGNRGGVNGTRARMPINLILNGVGSHPGP